MTDQVTNPQDDARAVAFNETVSESVLAFCNLSQTLISRNIPPHAVALAAALSSADLIALIAIDLNKGKDYIDILMTGVVADMKDRVTAAFNHYSEIKKSEVPA